MKSAANRFFDVLASLPPAYRVAIALALKDLGDELLVAAPSKTTEDEKLATLAEIERKYRDSPASVRETAAMAALGCSRATYYRKREKLLPVSSVSRNAICGETGKP